METPIDLLKIAKEKLELDWQIYQLANPIVCDHAREYHIGKIQEYEQAINILNKELANIKYL